MAEECTTAENGNGIGIKTPWGSITSKRGSEFIAIVSLALLAAVLYGGWQVGLQLASAMQSLSKEQRRMTCVISVKQEDREATFTNPNSFCNRIAGS